MKKSKGLIICLFALILILAGGVGLSSAPKNPIIAKKLADSYAEEIVEYSSDSEEVESSNQLNTEENLNLCIIGNASESVAPDSASITAVIETLDLDIKKSKDSNFEIFDKIVDGLEKAGITKENIVVDSYTSYPSYDYSSGRNLIGYYSVTAFSFDVDNLNNLKNFIDVAMENGATSIRNVVYKISNIEEVYSNVMLSALENAKTKAQKISNRDDLQIKSIKEEYVYSCASLYKTYNEGLNDNSMVGNVDVQARVVVEFE